MFPLHNKLIGKTIESIEGDEWDELLIIKFTDNTKWVIWAQQWNAHGAICKQKVFGDAFCEQAVFIPKV